MNIEFDKLRQVCIHSSGKALSKCFKTASQCMEQNCPLKAEDIAVRMSNGVVQEIFASLKAEEKVCRWRPAIHSDDMVTQCGYIGMLNGIYTTQIYCYKCGGKIVEEE